METKYIQIGDYTIIINSDDLERVTKFSKNKMKIMTNPITGSPYPVIRKELDKKRTTRSVARLIMNIRSRNKRIVYADNNPLNLTRENLIITDSSSSIGKSKSKTAPRTSKYMGVSFAKERNKWYAQIKPSKEDTNKNLGYFEDEREAAKAYNDAAQKYHGKFATLNKL